MAWKPAMGVLAAAAMGLVPAGEASADVPSHLSPFVDLDCRCAGLMIAPPKIQKQSPMTAIGLAADGTMTTTTLPISMTVFIASDGAGTMEMVQSEAPTAGATNPHSPQQMLDSVQAHYGDRGEVGSFRGYPSFTVFGQMERSDGGPAPFSKNMDVFANDRSISVFVMGDSADDVLANFDALTATLQIL